MTNFDFVTLSLSRKAEHSSVYNTLFINTNHHHRLLLLANSFLREIRINLLKPAPLPLTSTAYVGRWHHRERSQLQVILPYVGAAVSRVFLHDGGIPGGATHRARGRSILGVRIRVSVNRDSFFPRWVSAHDVWRTWWPTASASVMGQNLAIRRCVHLGRVIYEILSITARSSRFRRRVESYFWGSTLCREPSRFRWSSWWPLVARHNDFATKNLRVETMTMTTRSQQLSTLILKKIEEAVRFIKANTIKWIVCLSLSWIKRC